ncbi:hypothetical protein QBC38DRAFT_518116 [Podospora fimiseda]|uniref:Uncharacterized protein n=1 Tax=Podospora fimiseda TaxID=252190 RepID=A0AAN6YR23_9PEZI|nr:hypothetical protein QBC38DRAFT_518116 [Podospora fimiseda]
MTIKAPRCNNPKGFWEEGDIAFFLKNETNKAGIPAKATGHPAIILARPSTSSSHALVATVSAYGSGDLTSGHYVAPWNNPRQHRYKPDSFRSFAGSEVYAGSPPRPVLRLRPGGNFPKPETSWVNVENVYVVRTEDLGVFTKSRRFLQMEESSLVELRADMEKRCPLWAQRQRFLHSKEKKPVAGAPTKPAAATQPAAPTKPAAITPLSSAISKLTLKGGHTRTPTAAVSSSKKLSPACGMRSWATIAAYKTTTSHHRRHLLKKPSPACAMRYWAVVAA